MAAQAAGSNVPRECCFFASIAPDGKVRLNGRLLLLLHCAATVVPAQCNRKLRHTERLLQVFLHILHGQHTTSAWLCFALIPCPQHLATQRALGWHTCSCRRAVSSSNTLLCIYVQVLFWDVRVDKLLKKGNKRMDDAELVWKPMHSVHLLSVAGEGVQDVAIVLGFEH